MLDGVEAGVAEVGSVFSVVHVLKEGLGGGVAVVVEEVPGEPSGLGRVTVGGAGLGSGVSSPSCRQCWT